MRNRPFLSEEEFGECFRMFLIQSHPNPNRIGCPDSKVIRDLAFRRKLTPKTLDDAISHIMKCSECARDALDYVEEYKQHKQTTRETVKTGTG